jgi:hypothetical protein
LRRAAMKASNSRYEKAAPGANDAGGMSER